MIAGFLGVCGFEEVGLPMGPAMVRGPTPYLADDRAL